MNQAPFVNCTTHPYTSHAQNILLVVLRVVLGNARGSLRVALHVVEAVQRLELGVLVHGDVALEEIRHRLGELV